MYLFLFLYILEENDVFLMESTSILHSVIKSEIAIVFFLHLFFVVVVVHLH